MTAELVILAHATDRGARSVAARLASGPGPPAVRILVPELLGLGRWSHRVDPRGRVITRIAFPRAPPLVSTGMRAVLNRVQHLSVPHFRTASARDRDYATAELQAVVASWLCSLGDRVVQPVRTHPWVTPWVSRLCWVQAAAGAGLPVEEHRLTSAPPALPPEGPADPVARSASHSTVLVAGDAVGGTLARRFGGGCLAAARTIGLPLLEFRFAPAGDEVRLVHVDPLPLLLDPWEADMAAALLLARGAEQS